MRSTCCGASAGRRPIPAAVDRAPTTRRGRRGGRNAEARRPADRADADGGDRIEARRDGGSARRRGRPRLRHVLRLDDAVVGEARTTAVAHLRAALARAAGLGRPACIVSSGETTVHVTGRGKGGRNQEFALAAAELLAESRAARSRSPASAPMASTARPTPPARIADSTTIDRARAAGLRAGATISPTTTPTPFSRRWAISSTPVRPARTSATSK